MSRHTYDGWDARMVSMLSSGTSLSNDVLFGNVYLVEERRPKLSYELFEHALSSGCNGMIMTREFPKKLLTEKELDSCKLIWLTNLVGDGRVNPTAIGILMSQVRSFIENQPKSVVMIDGLEYMISLNTYDRMLQFMHQLRDLVVTNESILVVPMDPRTVTERELALLERNLEVLVPRVDAELTEEPMINAATGEIRLLNVGHR
ncbi:MAG: DUF835 domain-containing protein [Thermoplasmata archaeon]|nr:DUF835 domain-containing protein [Thermoplasmata archaeon]MCJ7561705.1 DUF835 domain-containing protein [Thermoplasmata archaeon]